MKIHTILQIYREKVVRTRTQPQHHRSYLSYCFSLLVGSPVRYLIHVGGGGWRMIGQSTLQYNNNMMLKNQLYSLFLGKVCFWESNYSILLFLTMPWDEEKHSMFKWYSEFKRKTTKGNLFKLISVLLMYMSIFLLYHCRSTDKENCNKLHK